MKRILVAVSILVGSAVFVVAQNSNTSSGPTRGRTATSKPSPTPAKTATKSSDSGTTSQSNGGRGASETGPSTAVLAAFDKIIDGIRRANVDMYMSGYWNSPTLTLFNYNGTVTKGWDQVKKNRESSFPQSKDVKLDIRERHVTLLGRDGAVVTCLWTQSQTFNGQPDSASGRMTLVFKRVGAEWKAVHLHTSPDKPDPARVPASEQTPPR